MTDEQLEPAARRLCEIRGDDPEGRGVWRATSDGRWYREPAWKGVLPELRAHLEREQALMDVLLESTNEWINKPADAGEEK